MSAAITDTAQKIADHGQTSAAAPVTPAAMSIHVERSLRRALR
jgi:hypothetical protein